MKYFSVLRPITIGTIPSSRRVLNIVNFDERRYCPEIDREAWGYIEYDGKMYDCAEYDLVEEKPLFKRDLLPGDSLLVCGVRAVIQKVLFQDVYNNEYDSNRSYIDCEIIDINGRYRHWKSHLDGGKVEYFDDDNHYDAFPDSMKVGIEYCRELLISAGVDCDNCLVFFKASNDFSKWYLYQNNKDLGYVDMGIIDDDGEQAYRSMLSEIHSVFSNTTFVAFSGTLTGGTYLVQDKPKRGYLAYIKSLCSS